MQKNAPHSGALRYTLWGTSTYTLSGLCTPHCGIRAVLLSNETLAMKRARFSLNDSSVVYNKAPSQSRLTESWRDYNGKFIGTRPAVEGSISQHMAYVLVSYLGYSSGPSPDKITWKWLLRVWDYGRRYIKQSAWTFCTKLLIKWFKSYVCLEMLAALPPTQMLKTMCGRWIFPGANMCPSFNRPHYLTADCNIYCLRHPASAIFGNKSNHPGNL